MDDTYSWGKELPLLSSERLHLRWLTPADAPALLSVFGDPDVMRYWSTSAWQDVEMAAEYIGEIQHSFAARSLFQWGICHRDSDQVIGTCTICEVDSEHRRAELGIILGKSAWGRGFASEALQLLIRFAFKELDLMRLEADVDPRNEPCLRMLDGQGFQREGLLRERWRVHGEVQDSVLLGLLRRDWGG